MDVRVFVLEEGLTNDINANIIDNTWFSSISGDDVQKGSLICLLRLPLVDIYDGNFILRIVRPSGDMIWEYDIDRTVLSHGKIVKDTYKGDKAWPADITPVKLLTDVQACIQQ